MKTRTLVSIIILVLAVLIIFEGYATEKKVSKKDYKFVSGTWINEEYNSYAFPARYELHRDGTFDGYSRISDTGKKYTGYYAIVDKWTDSEGNIWYKMHVGTGLLMKDLQARTSLTSLVSLAKFGNLFPIIPHFQLK